MATSQMMSRHAVQLSEHFDSIQVVGTKLNPDGSTSFYCAGKGDLFARLKVSELWLQRVHMDMLSR
jgi:hypothetical protein